MSTAKQCKHIIEACHIYAKHIAVYKVYNKAPILACHLKVLLFFLFFFLLAPLLRKCVLKNCSSESRKPALCDVAKGTDAKLTQLSG